MDKVITTALLIIAGVVCTVLVINSVYPAVNRSSAAMVSIAEKANNRVRSNIEIIQTANVPPGVFIWVKNVGACRIASIEQSDVFFGELGNFERVPHEDYTESLPYWDYKINNDNEWTPMATLEITIHLSSPPSSGSYFVKMIIPNGISDEYVFSI